jgi:hypothetical protein
MTLAVRNSVLLTGILLAVLALAGFAFAASTLLSSPSVEPAMETARAQHWLWASWSVDARQSMIMLGAAAVLAFICLAGIVVSARLFRRVNSPEIYFVALFLMTACVELARVAVPLSELLAAPAAIPVIVTRMVVFARILGSLALFAAGVYAAGADYPRIGSISLLLAALSFVIIYFVPVDNSVPTASFLFVTGGRGQIDFLIGFLSLGTILNYAIGWLRGYHDQSPWLVVSAASLVAGKEIVLHLSSPVMLGVGLLLVAAGVFGIVLVNRAYYLWS